MLNPPIMRVPTTATPLLTRHLSVSQFSYLSTVTRSVICHYKSTKFLDQHCGTAVIAMALFLCSFCGVQRPVHTSSWMKSQVDNILRNGSSEVGFYNSCRQCSPCCWVDPPLPVGVSPPNLCIVCCETLELQRNHWIPSQIRSIWSLHTSVTDRYNCCRSCNPGCWVSILDDTTPFSPYTRPTESMPPSPIVPSVPSRSVPASPKADHQHPEPAPPPPPSVPPPPPDHNDNYQSHWRPLPSHARPLLPPRPRWLDEVAIINDIQYIQEAVPATFWDLVVENLKKPVRTRLSWWGACFISDSAMGREVLALSNGGCDVRGKWINYHNAIECIKVASTPSFLDVGNIVYKDFLTQLWPSSPLWNTYSNQVNIGDIIEAVFGIVIYDWAFALTPGTLNPRYTENRSVVLLKIMSRICLAAYCDSRRFGKYIFR